MANNASITASLFVVVTVLLAPAAARSEPHVLRLATVAPDGTSWAHESRAFARDVEAATQGELRIKWYFGGVAGDEPTIIERLRKRQIDGTAGAILCQKLAPALMVTHVVGLFRNRDEANYVLGKISPTIDQQFRQSGFVNLGVAGFGVDILFSREPIRSMADLRRGNFWIWDIDDVLHAQLPAMGIHTSLFPLEKAARAYDDGKIDGFIVVPSAALSFQWSVQAGYFTNLQIAFQPACLLLTTQAMDALPLAQQKVLRTAASRMVRAFDEFGRAKEAQLLDGLFERQGLKRVSVDATLRNDFFAAARIARATLGDKLVPAEILQRVVNMLADYRAEQRAAANETR
jgi:TRAP-type C4-dicarboxylate transport system substrate-binding protein